MTITRTIKTRLAIEGEAEYQSKMQQCSAAIRETDSVLELLTAKYADNADSMEALTAKGDVLQRMYDQQAEKARLAAEALENARKAQDDHARSVIETRDKLSDAEKQMQEYADAGKTSGEAFDALNKEIGELRKQLADSEAMYDAASKGVTKWQREVNKAEAALYKTDSALRKNNEALEKISDNAEDASDAAKGLGEDFDLSSLSAGALLDKLKSINPVVGATATALIAAGKAAYDFAEQYQDAASVIGKATGAIGDDLYELTDTAYRAAAQVDATLEDVAAATGEINTRYGLVGDELEALTAQFANFADVNNVDLVNAVQNVSKIMRNYGLATEDANRLMDMLTVAAQKSGIAFSALSSQLINGKAQFMEFGYSLEESIALIAMAELEGLNLNSMLQGFRTAATVAAKAGKDLPRMLDDTIKAIEDAATEQKALNIATEAFGTRAAQEMLLAIRSGRFEIGEWVAALENSQGVMDATGEATDTFGDKWQQLKNQVAESVVQLRQEFDHLTGATADALTTSEESFAAAAEGYDRQSEHIEASAIVVERYVQRLKELEAQGIETSEQQAEYNRLIEQIKTLMPDLNLEIDKQTGLLKDGADAIMQNVAAWKEYAKMQAAQQFKADTQQAYIDALSEEQELRSKRVILLQREAQAQAAYDAEYQKYAEELDEINEAIKRNGNNAREYASRIQQIENAMSPFKKALSDVRGEIEDVDEALETNAATIKQTEEAVDALDESYSDLNDGLNDTDGIKAAEAELDNYVQTMQSTVEQSVAAMEQLEAEYAEAQAAAYTSIDSQIGKWKEFKTVTAEEAAAAVDAINTALDSQIEYLTNYTENFNNLMSRDIEGIDLLAEKLSDGSEESAAILAGLTKKTDEEIEEIVKKLGTVEEGKDEFSKQVALMETDYDERMKAIKEDTETAMDDILLKMRSTAQPALAAGVDVGGSFNEGLRSKLSEARQIAAEFTAIFNDVDSKLGRMDERVGTNAHSHANGLYAVPYDEYPAILHKGERVLTAAEARLYNAQERSGGTDNSKTVNVGGITVNGDASDRKTARMIKRAIREAVR